MPAQYPAINDREFDLLKKLVGNTALIAEGGGGTTYTAGAGLDLVGTEFRVKAAQTTITSITSPGALTLTATGQNLNLVSNKVVSDNTIEILGTWGVDAASGNAVHYVTALIGWSPAANPTPTDALDTAFYRNAAGVAEINNGTPGTFRDLKLRATLFGGSTANDVKLRKEGTTKLGVVSGDANAYGYLQTSDLTLCDGGGGNTVVLSTTASGVLTVGGSITTGAPSGGSAAAWKLGAYSAGAPTVEGKIRVEVGGAVYLIAVEEV